MEPTPVSQGPSPVPRDEAGAPEFYSAYLAQSEYMRGDTPTGYYETYPFCDCIEGDRLCPDCAADNHYCPDDLEDTPPARDYYYRGNYDDDEDDDYYDGDYDDDDDDFSLD